MRTEYHSYIVFYTHKENNFTGISFISAPGEAEACFEVHKTYPKVRIWRVQKTDMTFEQFHQTIHIMQQDIPVSDPLLGILS